MIPRCPAYSGANLVMRYGRVDISGLASSFPNLKRKNVGRQKRTTNNNLYHGGLSKDSQDIDKGWE